MDSDYVSAMYERVVAQHQDAAFLRTSQDQNNTPVIYIGTSSCGRIAGALETLEAIKVYVEEHNLEVAIEEVGCIGLCSAEPIVDVKLPGKNRIAFRNVKAGKVADLLNDVFNNVVPEKQSLGQYSNRDAVPWQGVPYLKELPFFAKQTRFVLEHCGIINPESIVDYLNVEGYKALGKVINHYTPEEVTLLVKKSGLRGRGGGGYPTHKKWSNTLQEPEPFKYLICNADESDPGAFMDRAVIEGNPHKLIEGIAIASYACGASQAYVYIRSTNALALKRLKIALKQAEMFGFIGDNMFNTDYHLSIALRISPGAFICGEETALLNSIEGKRGVPRPKPPYPSSHGLYGKPTVVNNVETLANVPAIIRKGPDWFRQFGTENTKGTKVFAVSGKTINAGLVEVEMGMTLYDVIYDICGGIKNDKTLKAIQIGGPSGACIAGDNTEVVIDYETLIAEGAMLGSGGMVVVDEDTCMVDLSKYFMQFLSKESCGKCIPCREGTRRMLQILEAITSRPKDGTQHATLERFKGVMMLEELGNVIKETSLCGLGQTAPNSVLSALKLFRTEFEEHIFERKCRANVCTSLRSFVIDVDKCKGCSVCQRKCPTNAIIGAPLKPHYIVPEKCVGCGICYESCKFNAIEVI